jgi:hypothetical protein
MAVKTVQIDTGDPTLDGYLGSLTALDTGETLSFPYNPESYSVAIAPKWVPRNLAGAEKDTLQWSGNGPKVVSYEHEIAAQNVWVMLAGAPQKNILNLIAVEQFLRTLQNWATRPTIQSQRPTLVRLSMGVNQFTGAITAFSFQRLLEDQEGYALTANVRFELTETR